MNHSRVRTATASLRAVGVSAAIAALFWSGISGIARAADAYHVTASTKLHGDGSWDYLTFDSARGRLYVSRATRVMVVAPEAGTLLGEISPASGVHGIALAQDLGRGFTSNGRDNSVTVFDLDTLKTIATIPIAGKNPDAIVYEPVTRRIVTFNGGSNDATVIDASTNTVVGTIALAGRPEFATVDGTGLIFNNIEDKNEVAVLDARTLAVTHVYSIAPCDGPSGIAMDRVHRRVFSVCSNKIMTVLDADRGTVIATPAIGAGSDAVAFDAATQQAISSNGGDGTLTVVHEDSPAAFSVAQTVPTQKYARTLAVDDRNATIYLVTADITLGPPAAGSTRPTRTVAPDSFVLLTVK